MPRARSGVDLCLLVAATVVWLATSAGCDSGGDRLDAASSVDAEPSSLTIINGRDDAPAWTIRYGNEFWRRAAPNDESSRDSKQVSTEINVGDVVDRVSHAVERGPGEVFPRVEAQNYTAAFDGHGLRFSPHRPGRASGFAPSSNVADPATELRLQTRRVAIGERDVYRSGTGTVPWSVLGNTAQGLLDATAGIVAHHEARADGVELSWVIRDHAAIDGDLVVEVALDGLRYVRTTSEGVHFADATGISRVRVGAAVLVDARGQRWPIATEVINDTARWRVDASTLATASFPIALDPTVSAEFGIDAPVFYGAGRTQYATAQVASNGAGYVVVWEDARNNGIYGARVSNAGVVQDLGGIAIASNATSPSLASNGADYLVAWTRYGNGNDIFAARLSGAGEVQDVNGIEISVAAGDQQVPTVASNGVDYFVSWIDHRGSNWDIYGARVTAAGLVPSADATGIAISTAVGEQYGAAVASNGTDYLVVWDDRRSASPDIYAARVTATGVVPPGDASGIPISASAFGEFNPSVASNGNDYLVTWYDTRSGTLDIFGARVTAAGTVPAADTSGIPICTAPRNQFFARVASNGTDYVVAWMDYRNGTDNDQQQDIYGARVQATGVLHPDDVSGIPLSTAAGGQSNPAVGSNGVDYLVTWIDKTDVHATRLTAAGSVQDTNSFVVSLAPNNQRAPVVASSTTGYFVAWSDTRNGRNAWDIYGARLSRTGVIEDPNGITISITPNGKHAVAVASNGTDYLVAWHEVRGATDYDIYAARVTSAGVTADLPAIEISTAPEFQGPPSIASNGADYLVAWQDSRSGSSDIYAARVTATGAIPISDAAGVPVSTAAEHQFSPSVASNGTDYLIAWTDTRSGTGGTDIYSARVTAAGTVPAPDLSGIPISTVADAYASSPSVASNGTDFLVAWEDYRSAVDYDVWAARVSSTGAVFAADTAGIPIVIAEHEQFVPSIASSGTGYFVTWDQYNYNSGAPIYSISGSGVTNAGGVQNQPGLLISAGASSSVAGLPGGGYLVAYESQERVAARLISICGDGAVDAGEDCDDSGDVAGDGCSPTCSFEPGYSCTGTPSACSDVNECLVGNGGCAANAGCANTIGGFSCTCNSGYSGDGVTCVDVDECLVNNGGCSVSGACTNSIGSFSCSCNAGYTGDGVVCSDVDECSTNNGGCSTNATCANSIGSFTCTCMMGFTGDGSTCLDIDECTTNNGGCASSAACSNTAGGFTCGCNPGYTGSGFVCTDVNECLISNGGCAQSCANTVGSHTCSCGAGYVLDANQRSCSDVNECAVNNGGCGQSCNNSAGSFTCSCASGYSLAADTVSCSDIDECAVNNGGCASGVTCSNTQGAFTCGNCPSGYTGDGVMCIDVNECTINNAGCGQACTNTVGAYACSCGPGFTLAGNASACDDVNECAVSNGGCDDSCSNTAGSFVCSCDAGYVLGVDGKTCADANECLTNNGGCGQLCGNNTGSYACSCTAGYVLAGDGLACNDIDECATNNGGCTAGVTCTNTSGAFSCGTCPEGYTGDGVTCTDVNECTTNNGGCVQDCANTIGDYTCTCRAGYVLTSDGHTCSDIDECATSNGGCSTDPLVACSNTQGTHSCGTCPPGFSGDGLTCVEDVVPKGGSGGCSTTDSRSSLLLVILGLLWVRSRRGNRSGSERELLGYARIPPIDAQGEATRGDVDDPDDRVARRAALLDVGSDEELQRRARDRDLEG